MQKAEESGVSAIWVRMALRAAGSFGQPHRKANLSFRDKCIPKCNFGTT
jgi:hypothetical protein